MPYIVSVSKDSKSVNKDWAVVSNNLSQSAPMTDNIFKNKGSKGGGVLRMQHPPLGVSGQCTVSLNNILITGRPRHHHCV